MRTGRRRARRITTTAAGALVGALALMAGAVATPPVPAATAAASGGHESVTLVSQTTWVTDRTPFQLRVALHGGEDPANLDLQVAVFRRLRSRSAFSASQRERGLGGALWSESSGVDQLGGSGGSYPLCVPVDAAPPLGCTASEPVFLDGTAGVYPVVITLRRHGASSYLDQLVTHLVLVPSAPSSVRLALALVVPVAAAQSLTTTGSRHLDAGTVARLGSIASFLGEHAAVPLTMAPDPATLAALADTGGAAARSALAELRKAGAAVQVLGRPFAPVAPYDLVDSGLAGELSAQVQRGADVERTELGVRTNPGTWMATGPLDGPTVDALRSLGVSQLVITTDELQSTFTSLTPAQPYTLSAGGDRIPALVEDAGLSADLAGGTDAVLAGHEVLADAAQTYFEGPALVRGVVAMAPRLWQPSRQLTSVLLDGLADSPILSGATVDSLFTGIPSASRYRQAAYPGRRPVLPASRIRSDRANQAALAGSATTTLPAAVSMNDMVLEAEAAGLSRSLRNSYLSGAEAVLAAQLRMISVVQSSVTLTARHATVPISVQSVLSVPIAVRVKVSSDSLVFANGQDTLVEPVQTLRQQNTTFLVPVTARNTGSFALRVSIVTANGGLTLTSARLTIKSRVFSGVGVGLSIGALAFLALWWGRELRKGRRRGHPPALETEPLRPRQPTGEPAGVRP